MKLEELCELTSERLQALSTEELTNILRPYFDVTRPELVQLSRPVKHNEPEHRIQLSPEKKKALEQLGQDGMDILEMIKKRKK